MNTPAQIPSEMTQADYARHRNVSRAAIGKAIGSGRIPSSAIRPDGKTKWIRVADADFALDGGSLRANFSATSVDGETLPLAPGAPAAAAAAKVTAETPALTKARTTTEEYNARIRQLEYEERIGKLVRIEDVARAMERCAEAILLVLALLPSRADDLATAFTRAGVPAVRALLREIEREIRAAVSANMKLLGAEDEGDGVDEESEGNDLVGPQPAQAIVENEAAVS